MVLAAVLAGISMSSVLSMAGNYDNFKVSVYVRAYEVDKMKDAHWLDSTWNVISGQLKVDKVYLETHRDLLIVDDATLEQAKRYFRRKGVETAGGITYTIDESNSFETFSYSNPEHRKIVQEIAEHTARHFDEFILDDFFFTNSKSEAEIKAKGNMSWTEFRLREMTEAGRNLVLGPARKVNPKVKVIIKYPNWYDDFQGLGFNLEEGPYLFDGVWTGTETRDPAGDQHLQNYLSYNIIRYFDNLRPGYNGGGWVDSGGINMSMDRYAEQLHLTMLAKAPEIILFAYNQLLEVKLRPEFRAAWQDEGDCSWNYDKITAPYKDRNGDTVRPTTMARIAGEVLKQTDELVGKLGKPVGVKSYKKFHSAPEAFLQNYLGMIGLPMDMRPDFAEEAPVLLLTAQAAEDAEIVKKIERQLLDGKTVVITSGMLKAVGEKLADIAEVSCSDLKAIVDDFGRYGVSGKEILIPQVRFYTNDAWPMISAGRPLKGGVSGYPILLRAPYAAGNLYVLTIPDDFGNLYDYPEGVLNEIRRTMSRGLDIRIEGPSKVALFTYDNKTLVVENFNDYPVKIKLVTSKSISSMESLLAEAVLRPDEETPQMFRGMRGRSPEQENRFTVYLPAHSYKSFKY